MLMRGSNHSFQNLLPYLPLPLRLLGRISVLISDGIMQTLSSVTWMKHSWWIFSANNLELSRHKAVIVSSCGQNMNPERPTIPSPLTWPLTAPKYLYSDTQGNILFLSRPSTTTCGDTLCRNDDVCIIEQQQCACIQLDRATLIQWSKFLRDVMNHDSDVVSKSQERWLRETLFSCVCYLSQVTHPEQYRPNPFLRSSIFWTITFCNVISIQDVENPSRSDVVGSKRVFSA